MVHTAGIEHGLMRMNKRSLNVTFRDDVREKLTKLAERWGGMSLSSVLARLVVDAYADAGLDRASKKSPGRPRAKDDITWWLKDATGYTAEKRPHKKIPQQCLDGEWYAQNAFGPAGVFKDVTWTPVYPAGYPEELKGFDHIKVARAFRETGEVILDDSTR